MLAGEFPAADRDQWAAAVAAALDRTGALTPDAALARLRSTTYDGITIEPLYTAADAPPDAAGARARRRRGRTRRGRRAGTSASASTPPPAPAGPSTSSSAGATSVLLDLTGVDHDRRRRRSPASSTASCSTWRRSSWTAGARWPEAADALVALCDRAGLDAGAGSLGADPLGAAAVDRQRRRSTSSSTPSPAWITRLGADRPGLRVVTVDGTRFHDAGASDGQELGVHDRRRPSSTCGRSTRRGVDAGRRARPASSCASPRPPTSSPRSPSSAPSAVLWARVAEVVGAPDAAGVTPVHAVTSTAMMTSYDPWVNMLRSTVACFAAGIAGADAVTVLPHDHLRGAEATELGRRIGRNTQSILIARVAPRRGRRPGRRLVVRRAPHRRAGRRGVGVVPGDRGGRRAARRRRRRARRRAPRRDPRRPPAATSTPAGRRSPGSPSSPNVDEPPPPPTTDGGPLAPHRWAAGLRGAAPARRPRSPPSRATARPCSSPRSGPPAAFTPRVTFAKNFFEVAGLATVAGPVTDDPATIADGVRAHRAPPSPASARATPSTPSTPPPSPRRSTAPAPTAVYVAGQPAGRRSTHRRGARSTSASTSAPRSTELLDLLEVP